ncbi:MAG: TonB-dependent receptor [Endomicrobium sp.]|jgi:outer membrane receptor protein involved in Fe transport|nr:TonB-dependent receptor [Endomicrobium sp.]
MIRKLFIAFAATSVFWVSAFSQDAFLSIEKIAQKNDFISQITVDEKEIEKKNSPAALNAVESVAGVFVSKGASAIKSDLSIRGMGDSFRRIGLFIDGRPEKVSLYGCAIPQSLLSGNVASVEVIKTADSVLYGGDGFGGLINIITRQPQGILEGSFGFSFGTFNTQNYNAYLGGQSEKIIYEVSVNKALSDGFVENSGYNASDTYIKIGYKIDDTSEIKITRKDFVGVEYEPAAKTVAGTAVAASAYDFKRNATDIKYQKIFDNAKIDITAFADSGEHQFSDGFHSKDAIYGINAHFENRLFKDNVLKYGAEYRYSDAQLIAASAPPALMPRGYWKKNETALFVLDEHEVMAGLTLLAGARYNYDEISGEAFGARAGFSYEITEKLNVRSGYSRSFRAPYLNELYTVPPRNPDLKAETRDSWEIGVNSKYLGIDFDAAAFILKGDNYIQETFVSPSRVPVPVEFRNSGKYEFKGFEVSLKGDIIENLRGYGAYSYLDAGNLNAGSSSGKITQPVVKHKADLSLDYTVGKFNFYVGAMFVFDYYGIYAASVSNATVVKLKDFNVFNAKVTFNITEALSVFISADNFTNQKYEMYIVSFGSDRIYEMPGITATGGVKYSF